MALDQALIDAVPSTLTYEDNGRQVPYRDHAFVKEAVDFPTFLKGAVDAHREVGARIPVRVKDDVEKDTWRKTHLPKLYDAGILERPPATPDDYNDVVKKPETLPEGWGWNDEFAKEFKTILHKHGVPKGAIPELLALHEKTMTGAGKTLQTSMDAGNAALRAEFGDKHDELREGAKRLASTIFKTPEELAFYEELGLGDHPAFLSVLMRLAPLAAQDSSFFTNSGKAGGEGGSLSREDARAELAKIMSDKTHPMNAGWNRNDPKVMEYVDNLYKRMGVTGTVEIT